MWQIQLMTSNKHKSFQDISDGYCQCAICVNKSTIQINQEAVQSKNVNLNCLITFIKYFPKGFPLMIVPTALAKQKLFYDNRQGNRLNFISYYNRITEYFPLTVNVCVFYQNKITIAHKYQLSKQDNSFIYIQGYSSKIPVSVAYRRDENFMDEVLSEKLESLSRSLSNQQQKYTFSEAQKNFVNWIHKQYEDNMFCKFMTKLYCKFIQNTNGDLILQGQFQWIVEKMGIIKLSNVKYLQVQQKVKTTSFQQQYQQKILQKLNKKQTIQIKLFQAFVSRPKLNNRVNVFRNQIRQMFNKQKSKILQKTQTQRTIQTKTQSDEVAKLFLPQLHQYSSLRQVLNDEAKFKKVVLGIDEDLQAKTRNSNLYPVKKAGKTPGIHRKTAQSAPKSFINTKRSNRFKTQI